MKPSEIIYQLRDLNAAWRKQDFRYTSEQQREYDALIQARRERVHYFYEKGLVSKGAKYSSSDSDQP